MWAIIAMAALQSYGALSAGKAGAEEANRNEAVSRHNARLAMMDAKVAEMDSQAALRETDEAQMMQLYQSEQAKGTVRVRQGASGASTSVGAPFRERAQMSAWLAFESFRVGREGRAKAEGFRQKGKSLEQEAASHRMAAKGYGEAKKNALRKGYLGAGTAILGAYTSSVA